MQKKVIIVGSGNAALSAGIAALEKGAKVTIYEKADKKMAGGNTKYTAGAMRFAYESGDQLTDLLENPNDERIKNTDFGSYTQKKFEKDLLNFNDGRPLSREQKILVSQSLETIQWLSTHNVKFEPIYSRQSFLKDGKHIFWGGLTLASENEGVGLFEQELDAFLSLGGKIFYNSPVENLIYEDVKVKGVYVNQKKATADSVILASGGFEANDELRKSYIGNNWLKAKVRGTPHNTGDGLKMALEIGASKHGLYNGCHATPMDLYMKNYGGLDLEPSERKNYRKICYFLGIMINAKGKRFLDEGKNFRNYTYAQYGKRVLDQPGHFAWQIFDSKVFDLLYEEYTFHDAHFVEADNIDELIEKMDGIDKIETKKTINEFNNSVDLNISFDPTILDGKSTNGIEIKKSNWAQKIDKGPFKAFPVTGGITFTYGGLKVNNNGSVLDDKDNPISGLFACGELVGGVFFNGYPGGSGLTSGAVFGRIAGYGSVQKG
ncbi:FAD-dependent tricarballylate dehydrogenase TcuA [Alphaproteobacteria bacterium]|nr:FAD-dependent tricarballylate dehydrogenase TcuA [Alphaproteobacteria bacterium]